MDGTIIIRTLQSSDREALAALHAQAFGPGRFARTAYRVREGHTTQPEFNLCVEHDGALIGAIQFTPVIIGETAGALLLGPLVIAEACKNKGWGLKLMLEGMSRAVSQGYRLVILVGDPPYYARAGFAVTPPGHIEMPGPVDPARLLYAELVPGVLTHYRGSVGGASYN